MCAFQSSPILFFSTHTYVSVNKRKRKEADNILYISVVIFFCSAISTHLSIYLSGNSAGLQHTHSISPGALGNTDNPFIAITSRSTLLQTGSTWKGLMYGPNRTSVLSTKLNWIWWWGSSPRALVNAEYPFINITPWSTLTQTSSTCKGFIYWSNGTNVLGAILNWIWWWGSSPGALGNVEYPFIAITTRSTKPNW